MDLMDFSHLADRFYEFLDPASSLRRLSFRFDAVCVRGVCARVRKAGEDVALSAEHHPPELQRHPACGVRQLQRAQSAGVPPRQRLSRGVGAPIGGLGEAGVGGRAGHLQHRPQGASAASGGRGQGPDPGVQRLRQDLHPRSARTREKDSGPLWSAALIAFLALQSTMRGKASSPSCTASPTGRPACAESCPESS
eukprot:scaffold848_cov247-Pinguiococcus_pyrenoidosus.AAC.12